MKKGITKLLRNDKRVLVIAFIVLALVVSISSKAYVSASDNDGQVTDPVASAPALNGEEITLRDAIEAASSVEVDVPELQEDVQKQGDTPTEDTVTATDAGQPAGAGEQVAAVEGQTATADDTTGTSAADTGITGDEIVAGEGEVDGVAGGDDLATPPTTEAPPTVEPTETLPETIPDVTVPEQPANDPAAPGDNIALPGDSITPIDTDETIEAKQPEIIMIDPGTELTPEEAFEPVVKPVVPSVEQEKNDLDNETDRSQEAVFPDGYSAKGDKNSIRLSYEEIMKMLESLPEGTDVERQMVVLKAYSLVGKVGYFWGGKSTEIGWDIRWGNSARVTSGGSKTSGTLRSFGLDCSGYVTWVFNNSAGMVVNGLIGDGSSNQWFKSEEIANVNDALPGDLAFFAVPGTRRINHVGVVIGMDDEGRLLVAHCSSSRNNVVITEYRASGFRYLRRPNVYDDEAYLQGTREMLGQEDIGYAYCWLRSDESAWEQAEVGDLVFKQAEEEEGVDQLETGVIRRIDEDGKMWVSKMPYNASSEVFDIAEEGYQSVRKPTNLLDQKIKYKLDENNPFEEDAFIVMQP